MSSCTAAPRRRPSCSTRWSRARRAARRLDHAPALRGAGAAPAAGDGRALPPPRALHRRQRARRRCNEGRADYMPVFLSEIPALFARRALPVDVALIQVSPPDAHGFCSLGVVGRRRRAAAMRARRRHRRRSTRACRARTATASSTSSARSRASRSTSPPSPSSPRRADRRRRARDRRARRRADRGRRDAPDGDRRDPRRGRCARSRDKRDLGVHTEMFSDGIVDLVERGVVTGARKTLHRGKIVAALRAGHAAALRLRRRQPVGRDAPVDYVNDPFVIAATARWSRSTRRSRSTSPARSAPTRSARASTRASAVRSTSSAAPRCAEAGGRSSRCPSTAPRAARSRIVAPLAAGAGVVTTRADVHYVVTEHGVAELHGARIARAGARAHRDRRPAVPRRAGERDARRAHFLD